MNSSGRVSRRTTHSHRLRRSKRYLQHPYHSALVWATVTIIVTLTTLLPSSTIFCYGFPNILTSSSTGCMTELSIEEVIMNNEVVPYEKSSEKGIKLVVMDVINNSEWMDGSIIEFDTNKESLPMYKIKMIVPDDGPSDVQYAIDTTDGGMFTSPSAGCDGKRDSSRVRNDPGVEFQIQQTNNDANINPIRVWAGWATGHEAVQLTDVVTFRPREVEQKEKGSLPDDNNKKEENLQLPCTDIEQELCPGWAAKGQCTENPTYMLVTCRKSCKVCDGDKSNIIGAPPKEQGASKPEKIPQQQEEALKEADNKHPSTTTTTNDKVQLQNNQENTSGKKIKKQEQEQQQNKEGLGTLKKNTKKKELKQDQKPKRRKHDADGSHAFQLEDMDRERRDNKNDIMKERDEGRPKKEKLHRKKNFDLSDLEEIPKASLGDEYHAKSSDKKRRSNIKGGILHGYENENYGRGNFDQGGFVRGLIVLVGGLCLVVVGCTAHSGREKRHDH